MKREKLFRIRLRDSSGQERFAEAIKESRVIQYLEDLGPRKDEDHFIRLDDGRELVKVDTGVLRDKNGEEQFKILGVTK